MAACTLFVSFYSRPILKGIAELQRDIAPILSRAISESTIRAATLNRRDIPDEAQRVAVPILALFSCAVSALTRALAMPSRAEDLKAPPEPRDLRS